MSFLPYAPVDDSNPLPVDLTGGGPAVVGATANSTGNSTITPTGPNQLQIVTITGSARTSIFILAITAAATGDWLIIRFNQPATAAIVQEVRNATAGGTLLYSYTTDGGGADHWIAMLYYNGSAWTPFFNAGNVV